MEIIKNALFSKVYEVKCFQDEFLNMTKEENAGVPPYPRYQKWLIKSLQTLDELGKKALNLRDFEQLEKKEPKICSIRYPNSVLNPRVLFVYLEEDKILLLAAFKEKSKSDYTRNISRAKKRFKVLNT